MFTEQTIEKLDLVNQALELMNTKISNLHYDGKNSLYRMAAYIRLNKDVENFPDSVELRYILDYLSNLPVRPARIFISYYGDVEVVWHANDLQIVSSKTQYIQLIMEFKLFLQQFQSPLFDFEINDGFFMDSPNEQITGYALEELNLYPKFNKECFGSDEEIEIIDTSY